MAFVLLPTSRFKLFSMAFHNRSRVSFLRFSSSPSNLRLFSSSSSMTAENKRDRNPTENWNFLVVVVVVVVVFR